MRWLLALLVFAATAALAHLVVLNAIPGRVMAKAQAAMAERGVPVNEWSAAPRMTPQTQTVVRPSPDLSYAICRFDVSDGPVLLSAPTAETYGSLSIFDSRTDNVFVASLREGSNFRGVIVYPPGSPPGETGEGVQLVEMKGPGLALIRRLAPSPEMHEAAAALVEDAYCGAP